ncbi:hypothetical protein N7454_011080 [Penicillium verhagenii]|nr:hypothetical protein N7454_011080 [Penicillium verhagenii]
MSSANPADGTPGSQNTFDSPTNPTSQLRTLLTCAAYRTQPFTSFTPGEIFALPRVIAGPHHQAPGEWAALVMKMDLNIARKGNMLKTDALKRMFTMPAKREPTLQFGKASTSGSPLAFNDAMDKYIYRFEGVAI